MSKKRAETKAINLSEAHRRHVTVQYLAPCCHLINVAARSRFLLPILILRAITFASLFRSPSQITPGRKPLCAATAETAFVSLALSVFNN